MLFQILQPVRMQGRQIKRTRKAIYIISIRSVSDGQFVLRLLSGHVRLETLNYGKFRVCLHWRRLDAEPTVPQDPATSEGARPSNVRSKRVESNSQCVAPFKKKRS